MRMKRAGREAMGALMVAPAGVGAWHASRPAAPDRRMDRVDPRGGVGTRHRLPVALVQERWEGEQTLPEPRQVGTAITPKDLRHLRHVRSASA
jgi:hypothetical protein